MLDLDNFNVNSLINYIIDIKILLNFKEIIKHQKIHHYCIIIIFLSSSNIIQYNKINNKNFCIIIN